MTSKVVPKELWVLFGLSTINEVFAVLGIDESRQVLMDGALDAIESAEKSKNIQIDHYHPCNIMDPATGAPEFRKWLLGCGLGRDGVKEIIDGPFTEFLNMFRKDVKSEVQNESPADRQGNSELGRVEAPNDVQADE